MDERLIENGDVTLRVEVTGDGPTVVCVPGWPELSSSWRHQVEHLSRSRRVAALDVRGYGGSSVPPEVDSYTLCELASDVAAVARVSATGNDSSSSTSSVIAELIRRSRGWAVAPSQA